MIGLTDPLELVLKIKSMSGFRYMTAAVSPSSIDYHPYNLKVPLPSSPFLIFNFIHFLNKDIYFVCRNRTCVHKTNLIISNHKISSLSPKCIFNKNVFVNNLKHFRWYLTRISTLLTTTQLVRQGLHAYVTMRQNTPSLNTGRRSSEIIRS